MFLEELVTGTAVIEILGGHLLDASNDDETVSHSEFKPCFSLEILCDNSILKSDSLTDGSQSQSC